MKLEQQVCSLELAKRLKELGVKHESLFYWIEFRNESSPEDKWPNVYHNLIRKGQRNNWRERSYLKDLELYSAFTVAELGEMLPKEINDHKTSYLEITHRSGYWQTFYLGIVQMVSTNQTNAYAKMLIYLIENGLIEND